MFTIVWRNFNFLAELYIIKNGVWQKIDIYQSLGPTCGVNRIYGGSFTGKLIDGQGLFAKALIFAGYKVIDSEDV